MNPKYLVIMSCVCHEQKTSAMTSPLYATAFEVLNYAKRVEKQNTAYSFTYYEVCAYFNIDDICMYQRSLADIEELAKKELVNITTKTETK